MELFDYLLAKKKAGGGGGSSDLDWSAIGYDSTPQSIVDGYNYAKYIQENWVDNSSRIYDFPKAVICPIVSLGNRTSMSYFASIPSLLEFPLLDTSNITSFDHAFSGAGALTTIAQVNTINVTDMNSMFEACTSLTTIPLFNTINVTNMNRMFASCQKLTTIPLLDTSKVTNMNNMFSSCPALTDTSLDNILQMCINATSYTGTKTLRVIGFAAYYYPVSRIQALPHYQDFIDAGWTIGY